MSDQSGITYVITTADGSPSLYVPGSDETYHSRHGALTESMHVFIHHGLREVANNNSPIRILEVGLGTGLNAALASLFSEENRIHIQYFAVEPQPVTDEVFRKVFEGWSTSPHIQSVVGQIFNTPWKNAASLHERFQLTKFPLALQQLSPETDEIDLVFFDAFAPRVQPELWTTEIFSELYRRMNHGGRLVTYCAKGEVRRSMQAAGFLVERLPGPPGKREMLRASRLD